MQLQSVVHNLFGAIIIIKLKVKIVLKSDSGLRFLLSSVKFQFKADLWLHLQLYWNLKVAKITVSVKNLLIEEIKPAYNCQSVL